MILQRSIALMAVLVALCVGARAEINTRTMAGTSHIILPAGDDDYARLAARAAAGDKNVDFRALRFAYLTSAARKGETQDPRTLRKALFDAVRGGDDQKVRAAAETLISASYIDMFGHKFLRAACERVHDDACAAEEHFVEFGLLKSIVGTGDGKTCQTGWEVVTVDEEYFLLSMLGATPKRQSLINGPPSCDALDTSGQNGQAATYFFRIEAVLADEQRMFGGAKSQ